MRFSATLTVCILVLAGWLILASPVAAKTVYVSDHFRITLRQSPSQTAKIKSMLSTGDSLEVLETRENWLRVRADEGQTGWILRRFSMDRLPRALVVDRLRERVETLEENNTQAEQRIQELTQARNRLSEELESTNQTLQQVRGEYEELRSEVPDLPRVKEQLEQTGKELEDSRARIEELKKENASLRSRSRQLWFLVGAGVVFVSCFVGFILGRLKRKKSRSVYF